MIITWIVLTAVCLILNAYYNFDISGANLFTVLDVKFVCACNKASRYCTPTFSRFYADFLQIIHLLYNNTIYCIYSTYHAILLYGTLWVVHFQESIGTVSTLSHTKIWDEFIDKMDLQLLSYFVGGCGSCYAFSSMGMNEARWRIRTNNTEQPVFSPQDIVECSQYSQGTYMYYMIPLA